VGDDEHPMRDIVQKCSEVLAPSAGSIHEF
jgi:hypothetical protein